MNTKGKGKQDMVSKPNRFLGLACMVMAGYSGLEVSNKARDDQNNIQGIANLRVKALRISQLARDATAGGEESFDGLSSLNAQMNGVWQNLKNSLVRQGEVSRAQIQSVSNSWDQVRENLTVIGR